MMKVPQSPPSALTDSGASASLGDTLCHAAPRPLGTQTHTESPHTGQGALQAPGTVGARGEGGSEPECPGEATWGGHHLLHGDLALHHPELALNSAETSFLEASLGGNPYFPVVSSLTSTQSRPVSELVCAQGTHTLTRGRCTRVSDSPAHLAVADPAHPGPGERWIRQEGHRSQDISREVRAHGTENDVEEGSRGTADT